MSTSDLIHFPCYCDPKDSIAIERQVDEEQLVYIMIAWDEQPPRSVVLNKYNAQKLAKHILTIFPEE